MIKRYDTATTPHRRALVAVTVTKTTKTALTRRYTRINPAAAQRDIQAPTDQLLTLTVAKKAPRTQPTIRAK